MAVVVRRKFISSTCRSSDEHPNGGRDGNGPGISRQGRSFPTWVSIALFLYHRQLEFVAFNMFFCVTKAI